MQSQCRAFDQPLPQQRTRLVGAGFQRFRNLRARQIADVACDKARAEIAVGLQVVRRTSENCGMSGQIDGMPMMVAAASACDAVRASTVTASAMPSEKTASVASAGGDAARRVVRVDHRGLHQAAPIRSIHQPYGEVLALTKMQRDIAAVVDIGAIEMRCLGHRARISSATAPATAAIGVMK